MIKINKNQIGNMLHALGIKTMRNGEDLQPNRRYSPYPTAYRNHFQTSSSSDWNILVQNGYAIFHKGVESWQDFYKISDDGKDFLKSLGYKWHSKK